MKLSLKTKATVLSSTLVVVLLAAVGWSQHRQLEQDFRAVVRAQLDTLGETIAADLAEKLDSHVAVVEHTAATIDPTILGNLRAAQDFVSRIAATRALFDGTALVGLDGSVLVNDPPAPAGLQVSLADRDYFQQVQREGRTVISPPIQSRSGRGPAALIITPIRGPDQAVLGYFSGGLQLERPNMLGRLSQGAVGRTGHIEVVTRGPGSIFVVHPDPAKLLQPAPAAGHGALDITYLVSSKLLRGVDWELRLVLPAWEADAPLLQAQRRLLRDLALMGLGTAVLTWLAMRWLLAPLGALHASMERIRRDPNSVIQIDTRSADERGDLARSFSELMRESRARQAEVEAITAKSPLGMFRAGVDGRLSYVNAAYLAIHGIPAEQAAEGWLQLVDPARREAARAAWIEAVRKAEPFSIVRELRRHDGELRQLVVRSAPVIVDGQVLGHVGTVFDATERNAQEKGLRLLQMIFETSPDYIVQTDRYGLLTYVNPALRRLQGMDPQADVRGLGFADFNPPDTNALFANEILPTVKVKGVWTGETHILGAAGQRVPVSHMVIAHRDSQGRVDHFSAVMRDISESQRARQNAEQAAAVLQSVADLSPTILSVVDADLRYRFVNARFEQWIGQPRSQILGRHASEVLRPLDYERSKPFAERALAGEEVSFERTDDYTGSLRHLAISYVPVRLASGAVDGFVGVSQDVTKHHQEAKRLRSLSERDPLTGALNRAGFEACIGNLAAAGAGPRLGLLCLDLDHFKAVNDSLGHGAGDQVLQTLVQRLQRLVRPTDAVARLGGDEFALVLCDIPELATAQMIADKVVLAAAEPFPVGAAVAHIGASVGVVYGLPPGEDWRVFVARADAAAYAAKRSGRGRRESAGG